MSNPTNLREPHFYSIEISPGTNSEALIQTLRKMGFGDGGKPAAFDIERKRYDSADACVYCGSTVTYRTMEDIIPKMIGDGLRLPRASCTPCQQIINKVETACCNNNFQYGRPHFGVRGQKAKRKHRARIKLSPKGSPDTHIKATSLSLSDHQGIMVFTTYPTPPQILRGVPPEDVTHTTALVFVHKDFHSRLAKLNKVQHLGSSDPILFGRLVAKIGHGFAMAELGPGTFEPFCADFILGKDDRHPAYWIGTDLSEQEPQAKLHSICIEDRMSTTHNFVVVRLRLFASTKTTPSYRIVVGEYRT